MIPGEQSMSPCIAPPSWTFWGFMAFLNYNSYKMNGWHPGTSARRKPYCEWPNIIITLITHTSTGWLLTTINPCQYKLLLTNHNPVNLYHSNNPLQYTQTHLVEFSSSAVRRWYRNGKLGTRAFYTVGTV